MSSEACCEIPTMAIFSDIARIVLGEESDCFQQLDEFLIQWIDDAATSSKSSSFRTEMDPLDGAILSGNPKVRQLNQLLRECVLSQRWEPATEVLLVLAGESAPDTAAIIQRVATEIVFQTDCPYEREHVLKQFTLDLRSMKGVNFLQIVFERILYMFSQNKVDEIKKLRSSLEYQLDHFKLRHDISETEHWDTLLTAYQGMLHYIEWKTSKAQYQQSQSVLAENPVSLTESLVGDGGTIDRHAQKAMECFSSLNAKSGVFDIFFDPQIEICLECERKEDAVQILELIIERNPDNPHNKEKLYQLYGNAHREKKLALLKDILKHNPSHPLALDLFKLQDNDKDSIHLLFDVLDCPTKQNDIKAWRELSETLLALKSKQDELLEHVTHPWTRDRMNWWPEYHFSRHSLLNSRLDVLEYKVVVGYCLLPQGNKHRAVIDDIVTEKELESEKITSAKTIC